jgi:hypothetical protein
LVGGHSIKTYLKTLLVVNHIAPALLSNGVAGATNGLDVQLLQQTLHDALAWD